MRLRRGRLCQGRRTRSQGTDSPSCGPGRSSAPSSRRFRPSAHDSTRKPCAPLRAAQIIARSSGPFPPFTKRARGTVTLCANLRPAKVSWTFAQPPRELRGGFASAKWGVPPRWRSPPLNRRGAWEGERKVFPCCSARCACAAPRRVASGISRAFWPSAWRMLRRRILEGFGLWRGWHRANRF